ncbi:hypothetical protein C7212DRAFT_307776 [Tuber magnatum]|uniref:HMG box domain-containing protein n=1 Tax=Tuber magnatum TaxID=42249 RepID=A0A317SZW2_9PEZI|nr:hypothetical protein C7212DRAFT_307776 [Tuber magnatum]
MSSLSVLQMAVEAGPLIHQRYHGVNLSQYLSMFANKTFSFNGSDGAQLSVLHMLPADWKPASGPLSVSFDSAPHTVIGTHHTIRSRPVYKLSDGSILLVFDPVVTDVDFQLTDRSFEDPQHEITGLTRFLRLATDEQDFASHGASLSLIRAKGVKRPANAFILFRTENMRTIKTRYPQMGNNDISKILGRMWQNSSNEAKEVYKARARQLAISHKLVNPNYKYTPRRSHEIRRRAYARKGLSNYVDLHSPGAERDARERATTHLGTLTAQFASEPSTVTLGEIIEEAEKVLGSFGLIN